MEKCRHSVLFIYLSVDGGYGVDYLDISSVDIGRYLDKARRVDISV